MCGSVCAEIPEHALARRCKLKLENCKKKMFVAPIDLNCDWRFMQHFTEPDAHKHVIYYERVSLTLYLGSELMRSNKQSETGRMSALGLGTENYEKRFRCLSQLKLKKIYILNFSGDPADVETDDDKSSINSD